MSAAAIKWAQHHAAPDEVSKAILERLADWSDDFGRVSLPERLAADVQVTPSAARCALRHLEAAGLVRIVAEGREYRLEGETFRNADRITRWRD